MNPNREQGTGNTTLVRERPVSCPMSSVSLDVSRFRRQTRAGPRVKVYRQATRVPGTSASSDTECHLLVPVRCSRPVLHSLSRRPHSCRHYSGRETRKRHIPPPPEAIIFRFTRPGRPPPWGEVSANSMCFSCKPAHQRRPQSQWHHSPAYAHGRHTAGTRFQPRGSSGLATTRVRQSIAHEGCSCTNA